MINLPFLHKKQEKNGFFLALMLKPSQVGAILFEEQDGRLVILSTNEKELERDIESLTEEELIQASDTVISFVEQSLPPSAFVTKTIFGLPYHFVENGKIKKEYLIKIKKVCENLELSPIGFIVDIEAIVYFLQKKDGIPITSIFIELSREHAYVYLVRAGNVIEVYSSKVYSDYVHTVEQLLLKVKSFELLPTKLILLSHDKVESIQQQFLSFPWKKELPFLHVPQVLTLEKGFENEAIMHGVATQMGFELFQDTKINSQLEKDEQIEDAGSEFGFIKEEEEESNIGDETVSEDVKKTEDQDPNLAIVNESKISRQKIPISLPSTTSIFNILSKITKLLNDMIRNLPALRFPNARLLSSFSRGGFLLIVLPVILSLIALVIVYYNFIVKAEVILFTQKKVLDTSKEITFTADQATDPEKLSLNLKIIEIEEEGNAEKDTSGQKETGDKAKGEVVIYNKTDQKKTFSKGIQIIGPKDLIYELMDDVNISSTSAFSTNFSNVKASVVASQIGPEYNLASNSNFSFKDFSTSSYFAKNESAFSGGTKKTISVVSKRDMESLEKEIVENLSKKVAESIKSKVDKDSSLLPRIISYEFVEKKYNKKEGEEAKKVSLTSKIKFKGGSYALSDVDNIIDNLSKKEIPSDYSIDKSVSKTQIKDIVISKDESVKAVLGAHSEYIPEIDENKIRADIQGNSELKASEKLKKIKNLSEFKVIFKNDLPFLPNYLPFNKNNIIITVRTNA